MVYLNHTVISFLNFRNIGKGSVVSKVGRNGQGVKNIMIIKYNDISIFYRITVSSVHGNELNALLSVEETILSGK